MRVLGISAYFHDSAAAILVDGKVIAAAQEERFSRIKHDASFPSSAIEYCLKVAKCDINQLDAIIFYEKPLQKFERIFDSHLKNIPFGFMSFVQSMKSWFGDKLWIPKNIAKELNYTGDIYFTDHHEAHAASAFYSSPFRESLIVVIDAVGEKSCTSIAKGLRNEIIPLNHQEYPHSIGLFYSAFTYYCGFKVNSGEYKLMGLAPYGKPKYVQLIKDHFISIGDDGLVALNLKSFGFDAGLKMLSKKGIKALGKAPRKPESNVDQFYKDIAASVQEILEEAVLRIVKFGLKTSPCSNIVLAGGVALNCVANQKLAEEFPEHNFWVQPASGDAGAAIGAAQSYYFKTHERIIIPDNSSSHVYLGPDYSNDEIHATLQRFGAKYSQHQQEDLFNSVAFQLQKEKIVGWFQGRMEFGPRALGNRSILASPTFKEMKSRLNLAIKKREGFRPFAPVILEAYAADWFDNISVSKYMVQTFTTDKGKIIPSCVHENKTSRVQTVSKEDNTMFFELLDQFNQLTGVPILINTSFNLRGEPIVCTPEDAINCFINTEMDVLVLNNFVLEKSKNNNLITTKDVVKTLD